MSKLLGHKSIVQTQVYAKMTNKMVPEAIDGLPALTISGEGRA